MTDPELIDLITRLLGGGALTISPLSGGSWSRVLRVEGASCAPVVAKVGNAEILKEEQIGLAALAATGAVRIPEVIGCGSMGGQGVLLLEHLQTGASPDWERFAVDLVALHRPGAESRYGFEIDNHLGSTVQRNTWTPDWAEFNRRFRHGPLLETVDIDASDRSLVQKAIDSFSHVLGDPPPVLLHGDLWSGNAIPLFDGSVALIDPAPYYGDPLADLAMMELFGGFPELFFDAYFAESPVAPDPRRLAVHRLYHALNHLHLFGRGYLGMVRREARLVLDD